jgi:O-antigen biosynthesis protein
MLACPAFINLRKLRAPNAVMNPVKALSKFVQEQKWLLFHRKSSRKDCEGRQLVNCLYQAGFGRFADTGGLAHYVHQLQSGVSLEVLAEDLVKSAEFQARHGSSLVVDRRFVTAMYRSGLGREPDSGELASWLAEGEKGVTRAKVLAAFAGSTEARDRHRRQLGRCLCQAAFGRTVDEAELARLLPQLQSGVPMEVLAENLVRLAEFQARHGRGGSVDQEYICVLYRDTLGRPPKPNDLASWLAEAEKGATRAGVLLAIGTSLEALEKLVAQTQGARSQDRSLANALFKTALGRPADLEGLAHVIQQLQSGASLEDLADNLVRSPEFQRLHGDSARVDIKYISALYRDGLGREPDLASLAHWLTKAEEGGTQATVLAGVAGSEEATEKLQFDGLDTDAIYRRWVRENDTIGEADRAMIRAHLAGLPFRPLISVIMPIEMTNEVTLRESFDSVVAQLYPHWELCLTSNAATCALVKSLFTEPIARDPRIKVIQTNDAESVVAAANAAFGLATGEFVTLLWTDDLLPEQALYEVAFELGRLEQIDIVYTDSDRIDLEGERYDPWFKPGWDPDLLLAQDYISRLAVYRKTLIEKIGFLRPEFDGAELHDLALRATNATARNKIRHLPSILYHRRKKAGASRPSDPLSDLRAADTTRRAVRDHLDARGDKEAVLEAVPLFRGAIRVKWPLPKNLPLVSVIIPTRDRRDLLARCVDGVLHRTDYSNLELLILDNESIESTTLTLFKTLVREEGRVRILHQPGPFNHSALNNVGARAAHGEVLVLLNNDIDVIESNWMRELVSQAIRPEVGIVGAKLLYADERVQHGGIVLGPSDAVHVHRLAARNDPGYFGQLALTRTLSAVTGACAAIRRSVFFEVDGFDETNLPVAFNDIDLCLKIGNRGYRVLWTPFAELVHLESASRGRANADPAQHLHGLQHLRKTWGALTESADPFHNPNLRFTWDDLEIPSAPRRQKPWRFVFEQFYILKQHFPR